MTAERDTMLPPSSQDSEEMFRLPYTNELILLSFEGHHKPFEVTLEEDLGLEPSVDEMAATAAGEAARDCSFLSRLKHALAAHFWAG